MAKVEVVMNLDGARALRNSPDVQALLTGYANAIAARAGKGAKVTTKAGKNRAHSRVTVDGREAGCPTCGAWHPNCSHVAEGLTRAFGSIT